MPRSLPWLTGGSKEKIKHKDALPNVPENRSPPERIVNSDLDDVEPPRRNAGAGKKRVKRELSSSPPPPTSAPEVNYMREGLAGDDIFMMVEDEFFSTAQLFTAHLHRAEYERLKRLHRSRGEEALANIERATDGRTQPSLALKMKLEAEGRRKKTKSASLVEEEESDDDDEYMAVPELAGLMTSSQSVDSKKLHANRTKAKSNTRAAAGYLQSPNKGGDKIRNMLSNNDTLLFQGTDKMETDDDDDDLDFGTTKTAVSYAWKGMDPALDQPRTSIERHRSATSKRQSSTAAESSAQEDTTPSMTSSSPSSSDVQPVETCQQTSTPTASNPARRSTGGRGSRIADILAKRRMASQVPEPALDQVYESRVADKPIKREPHSPQKVGHKSQDAVRNRSIEREPGATAKPNGDSRGSASNNTNNASKTASKDSQQLPERPAVHIKKEPEDKPKKAGRADVPTFLF